MEKLDYIEKRREGKGREGKGREGKGREEKRREEHIRMTQRTVAACCE
jgi:hypothetical protein